MPILPENKSRYIPHFLPGRGRRSGSQRVGAIHAVQPCKGDNFSPALCGKKPQGKSLGWCDTSREIDCKKCLKELDSANPTGK